MLFSPLLSHHNTCNPRVLQYVQTWLSLHSPSVIKQWSFLLLYWLDPLLITAIRHWQTLQILRFIQETRFFVRTFNAICGGSKHLKTNIQHSWCTWGYTETIIETMWECVGLTQSSLSLHSVIQTVTNCHVMMLLSRSLDYHNWTAPNFCPSIVHAII